MITNLLANMVLVSGLNIIQTNTPAFQEYARQAMITNAQAVAKAWHLDESLISTNNVTQFQADPTFLGIKGYIGFSNRYRFAYEFGFLDIFNDLPNNRMVAESINVETNDAINEQWMRATNLLTMDTARQLAMSSLEAIGMAKDFGPPKQTHQLRYEWKNGKKYLLPYYGFDWSNKKYWKNVEFPLRMEISGINGKVVYFSCMGLSPRLKPPTNYFDMLGLPKNPVFVEKVTAKPPTYEVVFDPLHPPKK
jgi:hypothetical protein